MSGSPEHVPTDKTRSEVGALSSFGIPQDDIALYIGIDPKTLRKHYRADLDNAITKANAAVGQFLFQNATGKTIEKGATYGDCTRAAIFWAKTRMGWKETQEPVGGKSEPAMAIEVVRATRPE